MKLAYSTIVNGDNRAYPGRIATVIRISGGPLSCPYLPAVESKDPIFSEYTSFFINLVTGQAEEDGETDAVVFTGVEPLWQGNAILDLSKRLRELGFFVKVDSSGFYSNDLRSVAEVVNFVSVDYKHVLRGDKYLPLIGAKVNFEVFQSNFLKSLVFLENCKAFKEVKTTVIPSVNDSIEVIEEMSKLIKNVDQYSLSQFVPWPTPLLDPVFEKIKPPTRLKLLELAQAARKNVGKVVVKCYESEEQEALPKEGIK